MTKGQERKCKNVTHCGNMSYNSVFLIKNDTVLKVSNLMYKMHAIPYLPFLSFTFTTHDIFIILNLFHDFEVMSWKCTVNPAALMLDLAAVLCFAHAIELRWWCSSLTPWSFQRDKSIVRDGVNFCLGP